MRTLVLAMTISATALPGEVSAQSRDSGAGTWKLV